MKSALVHYWLTGRRGGENVLEAIAELMPEADLYAHVIDKETLFGALTKRNYHETFIAQLPGARRRHQAYLPLMPLALELLNLNEYDTIVSSEAGPAKWVIPAPDAYHMCYCHSPLRYIWDQKPIYFEKIPAVARPVAELFASSLRKSDVISSTRVDHFIANSNFVRKRIEKYYRRDAEVIHPPVDLDAFSPSSSKKDFYLLAGELRSYKRPEIAINACNRLERKLIVVGSGASKSLMNLASSDVTFLGRVSDECLRSLMADCRALLFPGVEDFGIIPVEALASGTPVIGYAKGGLLDTVSHGENGVLYGDASVEGMMRAIQEFEAEEAYFSADRCVKSAQRFSRSTFQQKFSAALQRREGDRS